MSLYSYTDEVDSRSAALVRRRAALAALYNSLPPYGGSAFWLRIEDPDVDAALPLEVLVQCARLALVRKDDEGKKRIIEVIFRRTAGTNEWWANNVLKQSSLSLDEQKVLRSDLYADLCEYVIRAILDAKRSFWEENFQHCLLFERKHVYLSFMKREGRWRNQDDTRTSRVPHSLLESLDQSLQRSDGTAYELQIEDELAQKALQTVERTDLLHLIVHLPDRLKAVVLLIFWEDRTEKDTARVLGVTDRTVRNRLRAALKILHEKLAPEGEYANG
ncbi:MAG: hypothetical protein NVS4B7_09850 [Ktedonobacteraceae bacterium]